MSPLTLGFFFKIVLTILGSLCLHMALETVCQFLQGNNWYFCEEYVASVKQIWECNYLNSTNSFNAWTEDFVPFILIHFIPSVMFSGFHHSIVCISACTFFTKYITVLFFLDATVNRNCFSFHFQTVYCCYTETQKMFFSGTDLVSCNLDELVYHC